LLVKSPIPEVTSPAPTIAKVHFRGMLGYETPDKLIG